MQTMIQRRCWAERVREKGLANDRQLEWDAVTLQSALFCVLFGRRRLQRRKTPLILMKAVATTVVETVMLVSTRTCPPLVTLHTLCSCNEFADLLQRIARTMTVLASTTTAWLIDRCLQIAILNVLYRRIAVSRENFADRRRESKSMQQEKASIFKLYLLKARDRYGFIFRLQKFIATNKQQILL